MPEANLALEFTGGLARVVDTDGVDIADGVAAAVASDVVLINLLSRNPAATDAYADTEAGEILVPKDVVGLAARRFELAGGELVVSLVGNLAVTL